jgi:predicted GNAT superfamily acetyltransferase
MKSVASGLYFFVSACFKRSSTFLVFLKSAIKEDDSFSALRKNWYFNRIMAQDMELALDWRFKIRELFRGYFERGYVVKGFHRFEGRAFYRLEREETPAD